MQITELYEGYDDSACDKYDGIDYDICQWIRNERYIHWDDDQRDEARQKYGNVGCGTIYRGLKINRLEMLHKLEDAQKTKSGVLTMRHESATPDYPTAMSFALYVKSYDEMTTMYALMDAIERGSAGQYGTAIVMLRPTPDQVIVKTYTDGDEHKYNPKWQRAPMGLEQEAILYGDIEIVDAKIFYPLTKDNWRKTLAAQITSVDDLTNDFVIRWLRNKKSGVTTEQLEEFGREVCPRILKTDQDVAEFIQKNTPFSDEFTYSLPEVLDFMKRNLSKGWVVFDGKRIGVPLKYLRQFVKPTDNLKYTGKDHDPASSPVFDIIRHDKDPAKWDRPQVVDFMRRYFDQKTGMVNFNGQTAEVPPEIIKRYRRVTDEVREHFGEMLNSAKTEEMVSRGTGAYGTSIWTFHPSDSFREVARVAIMRPDLVKLFAKHQTVRKIRKFIVDAIKEGLSITEHDLTDQSKVWTAGEQLEQICRSLEWLFPFAPDGQKYVGALIRHIIHGIASPGVMTDNKKRAMEVVQRAVRDYVPRLFELLNEMKEFAD